MSENTSRLVRRFCFAIALCMIGAFVFAKLPSFSSINSAKAEWVCNYGNPPDESPVDEADMDTVNQGDDIRCYEYNDGVEEVVSEETTWEDDGSEYYESEPSQEGEVSQEGNFTAQRASLIKLPTFQCGYVQNCKLVALPQVCTINRSSYTCTRNGRSQTCFNENRTCRTPPAQYQCDRNFQCGFKF